MSVDDPLLVKKKETTFEDGMIVVQVGDETEIKHSSLRYVEDKYANPMKTAIDVENDEKLCPAIEVSAELLQKHRKALKALCKPTSSENRSGNSMTG